MIYLVLLDIYFVDGRNYMALPVQFHCNDEHLVEDVERWVDENFGSREIESWYWRIETAIEGKGWNIDSFE